MPELRQSGDRGDALERGEDSAVGRVDRSAFDVGEDAGVGCSGEVV
jgi:hypothetical protein